MSEKLSEHPTNEELAEALLEVLNGMEAGIVLAKRRLAQATGIIKTSARANTSKIVWQNAEGTKGPYQKSDDVNSADFKALVQDLAAHNKFLVRDGYRYWLFQNGGTVGRRKLKLNLEQKPKTEAPATLVTEPATVNIQKIKEAFPAELAGLLSFTTKEDYCLIQPQKFLGTENFARIGTIVRDIGGEYVSAGKHSHFRVPLKS